jgi:hypothetical protein
MLTKNHIKWLNNNAVKSLSAAFIFVFRLNVQKLPRPNSELIQQKKSTGVITQN